MTNDPYIITGSRFCSADTPNRVVLYTSSECVGCFSPSRMAADVKALEPGESIEYPALRFVNGPANPEPIVITRRRDARADGEAMAHPFDCGDGTADA